MMTDHVAKMCEATEQIFENTLKIRVSFLNCVLELFHYNAMHYSKKVM